MRCSLESACTPLEPAMSEFDAHRPSRGRSTLAVVVAVVFLAVLGGAVGVILGTSKNRAADGDSTANGTPTEAPTGQVGSQVGSGTAGGTGPKNPTKTPTTPKTYPATSLNKCPQQTVDAAGTELTVVLAIRTDRSEVWICKSGGKLYYQGHIIGRDFPAANSNNSLFRDATNEGGTYVARNADTTYYVTTAKLRIEKNGKVESDETVRESFGGGA
jgi:hypothetical protein